MANNSNRLSEEEVRRRIALCTKTDVVDEVYTFAQMLLKETVTRVRLIDTKAASMAAYGGAIVTLLFSTSGTWSHLGDKWTVIIAAAAGLSAFVAAVLAVKVMALREFEWLSDNEWLEPGCLSDIDNLKRYRSLTIWGTMDSYKTAYLSKVRLLQRAQLFLSVAVLLLLLVLLQVAWLRLFHQASGITGAIRHRWLP